MALAEENQLPLIQEHIGQACDLPRECIEMIALVEVKKKIFSFFFFSSRPYLVCGIKKQIQKYSTSLVGISNKMGSPYPHATPQWVIF